MNFVTVSDIAGIPEVAAEDFKRLLQSDPMDLGELVLRMDRYLEAIRKAGRENEFVDVRLAERITVACGILLSQWLDRKTKERVLIQAAVEYFILTGDAEDDVNSILGFEDDSYVINAVLRHFGMDEYQVELG